MIPLLPRPSKSHSAPLPEKVRVVSMTPKANSVERAPVAVPRISGSGKDPSAEARSRLGTGSALVETLAPARFAPPPAGPTPSTPSTSSEPNLRQRVATLADVLQGAGVPAPRPVVEQVASFIVEKRAPLSPPGVPRPPVGPSRIIKKDESKLPFTIQFYDHDSSAAIWLKHELGRGSYKTAKKAVLAVPLPDGRELASPVAKLSSPLVDRDVVQGELRERAVIQKFAGSPSTVQNLRVGQRVSRKNPALVKSVVLQPQYSGTVFDHFQTLWRPENTGLRRTWMRDVLSAIQDLHGAGVLHLDLKPTNLFVDSSGERYRVRLGDFGFAARVDAPTENLYSTPGFICPTFARRLLRFVQPYFDADRLAPPYQRQTSEDMWAAGVILFQMEYGGNRAFNLIPRVNVDYWQYLQAICRVSQPEIDAHFAGIDTRPGTIGGVIRQLLDVNPATRPTAAQALEAFDRLPLR